MNIVLNCYVHNNLKSNNINSRYLIFINKKILNMENVEK